MGIISRPVGDFVNGTVADGDQVDSDFNAIYNEFNGNIDNNNIKSSAAILGTKLADAPSGIPTAKINDGAVTTAKIGDDQVTSAKLQDHASDDSQRAVTRNHLKDDAVNQAKLDLTVWSNTGTITIPGSGDTTDVDTAIPDSNLVFPPYISDIAELVQVQAMVLFKNTGTWWIRIYHPAAGGDTIATGKLHVPYIAV